MIRTRYTDGGRMKSGWTLEKRDCTVRALALAANIPYTLAHDIAAASGRKAQHGWYIDKILPQANKQIGLDFRIWPIEKSGETRPTLKQVMALLPSGRFIIETRTHAMAVIDNVVYDRLEARARLRVEAVYEIVQSKGGVS